MNDFGIYRNIYRNFEAFFIISVHFDYKNRKRIDNMFYTKDIVASFEFHIKTLNNKMFMKIGGCNILIKGFPIVLITNIL